jgi:hypothetical protein
MSGDEIDVMIVQISRELAEKVHANPEGLRIRLCDSAGVVRFPEKPAGVWLGTAVYNSIEGQRVGLYQMSSAKRVIPRKVG